MLTLRRLFTSSRAFSTSSRPTLIVVGTGVAGSSTALKAASNGVKVHMLNSSSHPTNCNSYWAQGGIISRNPSSDDTSDYLSKDIMNAGVNLNVREAVEQLSKLGPERVTEMLLNEKEYASIPFEKDSQGELKYTLEAAHSHPRILYWKDWTGKAITEGLAAACEKHPLITTSTNTIVHDLLLSNPNDSSSPVTGVSCFDHSSNKSYDLHSSLGVVLSTGGLNNIYEHSTNPTGYNALGTSVALGSRVNAEIKDVEYVQFHPTALKLPSSARYLLTEALRGEGAILRDKTGRPFAKDYHPSGELAPRDVVARAVFEEDTKGGAFLDITHRDSEWLKNRFPSINEYLLERGVDMTKDTLPCVPAAHYTCGGVCVDLKGKSSVEGLRVAGEGSRTGVHGGNRLASTSLLEGLVWGAEIGEDLDISKTGDFVIMEKDSYYNEFDAKNVDERSSELLAILRSLMWNDVGIVRTVSGTSAAIEEITTLTSEAEALFQTVKTQKSCMIRDATVAAGLVAKAANENRVSGGTHFIEDDEEQKMDNA
ncbi:hypothetical protein TrST_g10119 [Triparma strigata]|uniref:L-aspartate oxidase n=1 Tax=Triparma strigata TaxID=1606541 RepID=A0A9W7E4F8_9STRA|nr:hypothetical protein TrST_g10119 [Triparma strigata]